MDVEKQMDTDQKWIETCARWNEFNWHSKLENSPALTEKETILNDKLKLELKKKFNNVEKTFTITVKDRQPKKVVKKKEVPLVKKILWVPIMFFFILDSILLASFFGIMFVNLVKAMLEKDAWTL